MPRYIVRHRVHKLYQSQDELVEDFRGLRRRAGNAGHGGATWLKSWYAPQANSLYCEWESDDEDSIRGCFTADELDRAPIQSVEQVVFLDPLWLDEPEGSLL